MLKLSGVVQTVANKQRSKNNSCKKIVLYQLLLGLADIDGIKIFVPKRKNSWQANDLK